MCSGLSQSALSYRSLTVTFCRKSCPIINGRLFLSISPITGLGLCELRELCERLILSSVWAVLLHKAGGVFTPRLCASAGNQQVVLDFFEIGWSVIVRSDCSASSQSKQNDLAQRRGGAGRFAIGQYWFIDICGGNLSGRLSLPRATSKSTAPNIDQCLTR
jgi:hypothetical protein